MKKVICLLLTVVMLFGTMALADGVFTPGTYEGTARGFNGDVTISVTVDENAILSVETIKHQESAGVSDPAFVKLPAAIVEKQTVALDAVTGCTFSSNAILEAAKAALLAAGAAEADITKEAAADAPADLSEKTYEADVVIIGAGGAGMTAAYEAAKNGASVIVIEKTAAIGGNTIVAGSALNGADEKRQKNQTMEATELAKIEELLALEPQNDIMKGWQEKIAADLEAYKAEGATYLYDSVELHALQTYCGGDYVGDPALIDVFAKGASESVTYMESLGTVWKDEVTAAIGATWQRSHMPTSDVWGPKGSSFVLPQATAAQKLGAQVIFEHTAKEITVENGRVSGVKGVTAEGTPFTVKANKSVIICTGGFGANVEMRQKYNKHWPDLGENVRTTNVVTATGDGIVMAEAVGANLVGMEWIQMLTNADKQDFSASINNLIFVNAEGKRFVREDGRRDDIASATLAQTGARVVEITDAQEVEERLGGVTYAGLDVQEQVALGTFVKADTIEELAAQFDMDAEALKTTIEAYNKAVETGADEFGRQVFGNKIEKAPFYGFYASAKVHHTMGGIQIDTNAQVVDTNGNVIDGLYAAGEVTGGIHGSNRLGGNAIADIVTFGRIAGQNACK